MTNESTIAELERELSGLKLPSSFGTTQKDGIWRARITDENHFVYAATGHTLAEAINGALETFKRSR